MERPELSELAQHAQQTEVAAEAQKERERRMHGFRGLPVCSGCLGGEPQGVIDLDLYTSRRQVKSTNGTKSSKKINDRLRLRLRLRLGL